MSEFKNNGSFTLSSRKLLNSWRNLQSLLPNELLSVEVNEET